MTTTAPSFRRLMRPTAELSGRGVHTGGEGRVRVLPAAPGDGISFRCVSGRAAALTMRATLAATMPAPRRLLLEGEGMRVSTPEHLLAALYGLGISDAEVELGGEEVPILDGSAKPFLEALWPASVAAEDSAPAPWRVRRSFSRRRGGAACRLAPGQGLQLTAVVDFGVRAPFAPQRLVWHDVDRPSFGYRLAPARSFGFLDEAASLRARGLARGARLGNLLIYGPGGPLNPEGTRFRDEPVRHKVLDALGALALLGAPLSGRLFLDRCGHELLIATLRAAITEGAIRRD